MINKNNLLLSVALSTSLSFSSLTSAQSLSDEVFKNVDGQRFWQVIVNCDNSDSNSLLNKTVTSEQWCINGSTECYTDKQKAAKQACSVDTPNSTSQAKAASPATPAPSTSIVNTTALSAPVQNTTVPSTPIANIPVQNTADALNEDDDDDYDEKNVDYDALRKEKFELEATRLKIQQEILELKRREIELQKSTIVN